MVTAIEVAPVRTFTPEQIAAVVDPLLEAENAVVIAHKALESAEGNLHDKGVVFGKAMLALQEAYKRKGKGWLEKAQALGIKPAKAYYWINVVHGKSNDRHKKFWDDSLLKAEFCVAQNSDNQDEPSALKPEPRPLDWGTLTRRMNKILDDALTLGAPDDLDADLVLALGQFAALLGLDLVDRDDVHDPDRCVLANNQSAPAEEKRVESPAV